MANNKIRKAEPDDYARLFEAYPEGEVVLEDLVKRFGGGMFVRGGQEGDRQTAFNCGARAVVDSIFLNINRSHNVEDEDNNE